MQAFGPEAKKRTGSALRLARPLLPRPLLPRLLLPGLLLCQPLSLTGCAERPAPALVSATPPHHPQADRAFAGALPADANGKPIVFNDPPAPPDTALCGTQAREANAIGAALPSAHLAAVGACAGFTCYDPLTATYIGADHYRHVCR